MSHMTIVGVMWTMVKESRDSCGGHTDCGE